MLHVWTQNKITYLWQKQGSVIYIYIYMSLLVVILSYMFVLLLDKCLVITIWPLINFEYLRLFDVEVMNWWGILA